jgi:hypothetical protein
VNIVATSKVAPEALRIQYKQVFDRKAAEPTSPIAKAKSTRAVWRRVRAFVDISSFSGGGSFSELFV